MKNNTLDSLIQLRKIVAIYGERQKWWPSQFFNSDSQTFIDYNFPKLKNANLILATDLIKNIIDHKVGSHKYHLFRLNIQYEEKIHKELLTTEIKIYKTEELLNFIEELSQGLVVKHSGGPKNIGAIQDLENEGTIQVMAAEYLSAFKNNYQVYPYFN